MTQPSSIPPLRAALIFVAVFAILQMAYGAAEAQPLRAFMVNELTVRPAAWLLGSLDPATQVWAEGSRLRSPRGGVNVLQGCEGVEVVFLLFAGLACARLPWKRRLTGMLVGVAVVFILNQLRVLSLFYAHLTGPSLFDAVHGAIGPLVMLLLTVLFFLYWIGQAAPAAAVDAGSPA
jgi:exosortase family protein XrtM